MVSASFHRVAAPITTPIPPEVAVVITNPPFSLKYEFVSKLVAWMRENTTHSFVLLLPLESMTTHAFQAAADGEKFDLIIPVGRCTFLHAGQPRPATTTAWYHFYSGAPGGFRLESLSM
jgi:hypothetical protein